MGKKLEVKYKIWFEYHGTPIIGEGGAKLLEEVNKTGSIRKAAEKLGMSYRKALDYIRRLNNLLEEELVKTGKGGRDGGGAKLTPAGKALLYTYKKVKNEVEKTLKRTLCMLDRYAEATYSIGQH